jgi:hypothetical protein
MQIIIDRFEGSFAVCEDENRRMINIERSKLPPGAKEGDVLRVNGEAYEVDSAATDARKQAVKRLSDDIWK